MNMAKAFMPLKKDMIIQKRLRKSKNVVYGARAMNIQMPLGMQRHTEDYDIYSKSPNKDARKLERELDKQSKGNFYYVKPAMHKGTFKVMDVGLDNKKGTKDDYGIADYTRPERKIKKVNIMGINYAHISERQKDAKKALRDPMFSFRHEKDKMDLWRIKQSKRRLIL